MESGFRNQDGVRFVAQQNPDLQKFLHPTCIQNQVWAKFVAIMWKARASMVHDVIFFMRKLTTVTKKTIQVTFLFVFLKNKIEQC